MVRTRSVRKDAAAPRGRAGRGRLPGISPQQREHMIAEAAYFRALGRGFQGGDQVADWLAAELEVDRALLSG